LDGCNGVPETVVTVTVMVAVWDLPPPDPLIVTA
jgi:hypothetical protein